MITENGLNANYRHFKNSLHHILDIEDQRDTVTRIVNGVLFGLIILNAVAVVVESTPQPEVVYQWLARFENFSLWIFLIEYILRIWVCNENKQFAHPITGRLRYMITPLAIIDLITILPFLLQLVGINISMLRILRTLRLLKFARLVRYSKAYLFIKVAILSRKDEFLIGFFLMMVTLLIASSLMYLAEHDAQPKLFSSIPAAFWWGVITFTSVGYGDVYPVTTLGKIIGGFFAIVGISVFALPTAILTTAMLEQIHIERDSKK
ncbi:MAG: ion transporter [Comamonadaceae bacterium]|nr:ion transporter [Comamonadaceae bacterium]